MNKSKNDYSQIVNKVLDGALGEDILVVTGGLRNKCFKYENNSKKYFIKVYNQDTKFSYHLSASRCQSEYVMCEYLRQYDCAVPLPLYCDIERQIGIYEYIDGCNLWGYDSVSFNLSKKIMNQLIKIHSVPLVSSIGGCRFGEVTKCDIVRYLIDTFTFISRLYNKELNIQVHQAFFEEIANLICTQPQVYGNMQMHNGNIMVDLDNEVHFVDFEKASPHFPQMDLISYINSRGLKLDEDMDIIDYYIEERNYMLQKVVFLIIYDLLFIIDNLRTIKKIKNNSSGLSYKWVENNGQKEKVIKLSDDDIGKRWNDERGENIQKRLDNIFMKKYYDNSYGYILRSMLYDIIK